ncbi:MAG: hypothetical protein DWQ04_00070 [Chloroflexi bacterium]|nr:MAG: hypothetical protein DWQ04_00070 [Chloroflexota bacterium]
MQASSLPELRPLSLGQLLDRAFRLYRNNFLVFIGIIAITQLPAILMQIGLSSFTALDSTDAFLQSQDPDAMIELLPIIGIAAGVTILLGLVSGIFAIIGTAAMTRAVADNYLGKSVTIMGSFSKIGRSWLTLFGTLLLMGLIGFFIAIPLVLIAIIPCLGWAVAFLGFVGLGAISALLTPVVIIEKQGGLDAIKRAWELFRLRSWWVIGYFLLIILMAYIVILGPSLIAISMFGVIAPSAGQLVASIVQQSVTYLFSIIFMPIQLAAITLMYFDLRIRFEGFDLMILAQSDDLYEKKPETLLDLE